MARPQTHPSQPLTGLLQGLAWIAAAVAVVPTRADPDLWGNLRFGFDVLASGRVSEFDPYSFTQDIPWLNHEWLSQVMMAVSYQLAGSPGLVLLKGALVLITLRLVARAFHATKPLVAEGAMLLVLWGAVSIIVTLRAQLWSFLGLAILVNLLSRDARAWRFVPLLFAVWVNCHIGWVIGLAVLMWWALGRMVRDDRDTRIRAAAVVGVSLLATLVNPYGWNLWHFTAGATHLSRSVTEWQPLWTSPVTNWVPWLIAVASCLALSVRRPRLPVEWAICLVVLAYVSAQVVKFAPLFVELSALFLAPLVRMRWPAVDSGAPMAPAVRWVNRAALAVLGVLALVASLPRVQCLPAGDWRPDATVARALIDARPAGRLAVYFDWGEYVIWHLGPSLRVSFDPRYDLVYSADTIDEQSQVARATPRGVAFIERTRPDYLWYPSEMTALKGWVAKNGYRLDLDTAESFLAVRADLPRVPRPPDQEFGCFPSP